MSRWLKNSGLNQSRLRPKEAIFMIAELEEKTLLEKLKKDSGFVYIARKVDESTAERVKALKIEGIGFLRESKRCYPYDELAAHTIGFAGVDNEGLTGLEIFYDDVLRGIPGHLIVEKDPMGRSISTGVSNLLPSIDGKNIDLTIDRDLQYKAEVELNRCIEKFEAKAGNIIVMRPNTGEILAIANYPHFNLNEYSKADFACFRNRAITDSFEPGSTIKMVIGAAALEEGIFQPKDVFRLPDEIKIADRIITESHKRPTEDFTFTDIITQSSNVGAVVVGQTPEKWSGSTIGNIPLGQGMSATSLQVLQSFSIIANDGLLVKPYLLSRVVDSNGKIIKQTKPKQGKKILSLKAAEQMKQILEKATIEGTGKNAQVQGYRVAGKTGTSQKPRKDGKGYEKGKYVASFVGFAPVGNPQLAIIVVIDEPRGSIYGGSVAAPVFKNLAEFGLRHLKIPPSEN